MTPIEVAVSRYANASPETIFDILADYRVGHPSILPKRYFGELFVEEGGFGAGTRIRFTMKGFGKPRELIADVEVPEPRRVLVERYPATGGVTTFNMDPVPGGTMVTITTAWTPRGVQGFAERLLAQLFLRRVFREELTLLAQLSARRESELAALAHA